MPFKQSPQSSLIFRRYGPKSTHNTQLTEGVIPLNIRINPCYIWLAARARSIMMGPRKSRRWLGWWRVLMGHPWIDMSTEPLGHLHPGNPPDPRDATAVQSWIFKPTIPPLSLPVSLSPCGFLPLRYTLAGLSWICPNRKVSTIICSAQRQGDGASWSYSAAMRGDTKAAEDKCATTSKEGSSSFTQPFVTSSKNKK